MTKFDNKLRRLVTERDAKTIRKKGKILKVIKTDFGKIGLIRKYKGATYSEWYDQGDFYAMDGER
jgi:hypothetical protein